MEEKFYIRDRTHTLGGAVMWLKQSGDGYTFELRKAGEFAEREARALLSHKDQMVPAKAVQTAASQHVMACDLEV